VTRGVRSYRSKCTTRGTRSSPPTIGITSSSSRTGSSRQASSSPTFFSAAPPLKRYDPSHPDADAEGYVSYPDINPLTEMVDLMGATRAYGLNASAVQAEKSMIASSLDLGK